MIQKALSGISSRKNHFLVAPININQLFSLMFCFGCGSMIVIRDSRTTRSGDRPVRIGPRFSNFSWSWSVPRFLIFPTGLNRSVRDQSDQARGSLNKTTVRQVLQHFCNYCYYWGLISTLEMVCNKIYEFFLLTYESRIFPRKINLYPSLKRDLSNAYM